MKKPAYECLINGCNKKNKSTVGIKTHLRRAHGIHPAVESEHYKLSEPTPQQSEHNWRAWQKYDDGSRKFRLIDGQWVKQKPGQYFRPTRPYKHRPNSEKRIETQFGQPTVDNGFILLPITLRIPFNLGIPQIIQDEQE